MLFFAAVSVGGSQMRETCASFGCESGDESLVAGGGITNGPARMLPVVRRFAVEVAAQAAVQVLVDPRRHHFDMAAAVLDQQTSGRRRDDDVRRLETNPVQWTHRKKKSKSRSEDSGLGRSI